MILAHNKSTDQCWRSHLFATFALKSSRNVLVVLPYFLACDGPRTLWQIFVKFGVRELY